MSRTLRICLKSGERIFVNGAELRADRKVTLEILNEVTFLLEHHVLQPSEATTPLRQLYIQVQSMLMMPAQRPEKASHLLKMTAQVLPLPLIQMVSLPLLWLLKTRRLLVLRPPSLSNTPIMISELPKKGRK